MRIRRFSFRQPSFTRGLARTVDVGAAISQVSYRDSLSGLAADRNALAQDWKAVGDDLATVASRESRGASGEASSAGKK